MVLLKTAAGYALIDARNANAMQWHDLRFGICSGWQT